MNSNEIQNDAVKTTLIKIETLQKEYEVTLQEYQEACQNYISLLTSNDDEFVKLKGRSWWGTSGISESNVNNENDCQDMCINSDKCSGATYNSTKRYCWTRTGESNITVGKDDDYAIIPKTTATLITMKTLNEKLLSLNDEIDNELTNIRPEIKEQLQEKNEKQIALNGSYKKLIEQKIEIEKQLEEYNSVNEQQEIQSYYATKENISMKFWSLVMFIILLVTIQKFIGISNPPLYITIWFIIIILLIVLSYTLTSPSGFMIWFLLIISIIVYKSNKT
jgi:hypothetical protein